MTFDQFCQFERDSYSDAISHDCWEEEGNHRSEHQYLSSTVAIQENKWYGGWTLVKAFSRRSAHDNYKGLITTYESIDLDEEALRKMLARITQMRVEKLTA